jgi:DNA-binding NtrC family response regulator
LRQIAFKKARQIILKITAFADEKTQARALKAGAYAYLIKPFDEDDLLEGIRRALQPRNPMPGEAPLA